jgi:hypothetical protein
VNSEGREEMKIALAMVERVNAGDAEGSLAYFADDVTGYIVGLPPTGMEVYRGKEERGDAGRANRYAVIRCPRIGDDCDHRGW